MATYLDGMEGGKHNSDNAIASFTPKKKKIFVKDEGNFYVVKFQPDGTPADGNKMYEYGTLIEKTMTLKEVTEYCKANNYLFEIV